MRDVGGGVGRMCIGEDVEGGGGGVFTRCLD